MAVTPSTMLPLGTPIPEFKVQHVSTGKWLTRGDFSGFRIFLVIFLCRHCPYVKHVVDQLVLIGKDYLPRGIGILGISSNDPAAYPDDSLESLKEMAGVHGFPYPLSLDESQEAAKVFHAACTPEFYLFVDGALAYRGQLDDSRPKNQVPVTGKDLRAALEAALKGLPCPEDQKPGIGCNIKWRPGNEPPYFKI